VWLALLLSPFGLPSNAAPAVGAEPTAPPPTPNSAAPALGLPDLLHLARESHPRLAAQRASLAAVEDGVRALDSLPVPAFVERELPVRRRQAALGLTAAAAAIEQAERDVDYAVTRTYFTVLYAREQERVASGVVDQLTTTRDLARQQLQAGARDVTETDVARTSVYLRLAEAKRVQAASGVKRALAALREAIGKCPEFRFDVAPGALKEPTARPREEDVIAAALARRGELVQANVFAEVACLEIEAQGTGHHLKMETFAAGSDIHSTALPPEVRNGEYRPGAIPPEMPTLLAGSRCERMQHAADLHRRALAVAEEARNLIALEVDDAFLRWEEAAAESAKAREAADDGTKVADSLGKDFAAGLKVRVEDVITARVLAAQALSQYNEYVYKEILALADLERATAGGFCAGLGEVTKPAASVTPTRDAAHRISIFTAVCRTETAPASVNLPRADASLWLPICIAFAERDK
jgi:outer membrane protein TolC